jgi:hypothetical protein
MLLEELEAAAAATQQAVTSRAEAVERVAQAEALAKVRTPLWHSHYVYCCRNMLIVGTLQL